MSSEMVERLGQPLDAARVKLRDSGRGQKLSYLETHDVIRTANDIFGFGRWGHEIVELRPIPPVTVTNKDGKAGYQVGYLCIIRLTVDGCVPVSGVGYGDAVEYRESAAVTAHELAAKEAESDALKRALKNFGDQFGLALYDKQAMSSGRVVAAPAPREPVADGATVAAIEVLIEALNKDGILGETEIRDGMQKAFGTQTAGELTVSQASNLYKRLLAKADKGQVAA